MARHIWTNEQIKYLKRIANGKPKKVTLEKINKKFNLNLSLRQLNNCMSNNNIKVNIRHTWTNEQIEYLKKIAEGTPRKEIVKKLNDKFNLNLTILQVRDCMNGRGIRNNIDKKFSAKDGNRCQQEKPIGTVSKWECGYTRIKTGDNEWEFIQRYVWKKHHGEIPPNHSVIFLDGNTDNYNIENLALVNRNELMKYNSMKLNSDNQELNRVAVNLAKLMTKSKELERGQNG
jgi:hypothetical protein